MIVVRASRGPLVACLLAVPLVFLTTWALYLVQIHITAHQGAVYARPFGIVYVLPIALVAALGGYRAGLFTLALSAFATFYVLIPPTFGIELKDRRDLVEILFLCLVGGLIVMGGEAMRRNAQLILERQEAAEQQKDAAERQRRFLRDVLSSVTDNRLRLCEDRSQLPPTLTPVGGPISLSADDLRTLRRMVAQTAREAGFSEERRHDLVTAASEAAMNAVVHGGGGKSQVCVAPQSMIQVWIEDSGQGIAIDQLPRAALERGHSTAGTLGHGFWLMLQTTDRLWLLTGTAGTTLVLEQDRVPPRPLWQ